MAFFEGQLKHKYEVTFLFANESGKSHSATMEEVTMPEIKTTMIKKFNNRLNRELSRTGRITYGDITLKGHYDITETTSDSATLLSKLYELWNSDQNTVDIVVTMVDLSTEKPTFIFEAIGCKLNSIKTDTISKKAEDDLMHFDITLTPYKINKVSGPQAAV
jgi:hypothetical protein